MLSFTNKQFFSLSVRRKPLIQIDELNSLLQTNQPIKILDSPQPLPPGSRAIDDVFRQKRIKGSQLFDYNVISDTNSSLPHMMPDIDTWKQHMQRLNIRTSDSIVIYDDFGISGACRAYWMFKVFNQHQDVYILNSDFDSYIQQEQSQQFIDDQVIDDSQNYNASQYDHSLKDEQEYTKNNYSIASLELVQQASYAEHHLNKNVFKIIDARKSDRFKGEVKEPREGLRSGNIDGSFNVFFGELLNTQKGIKENHELVEVYKQNGLDLDEIKNKFIINSCGSGVTACVNLVAQELMGIKRKTVYDGSWTEYGQVPLYDPQEVQQKMDQAVVQQKFPFEVELQPGQMYKYCTCGKTQKPEGYVCDGRHRGSSFKNMKFAVDKEGTYYLCGCRQSKNMPYCDGSHNDL